MQNISKPIFVLLFSISIIVLFFLHSNFLVKIHFEGLICSGTELQNPSLSKQVLQILSEI